MKAVSILAVTTALSLGGVVLLYVEQQDLKERLSTSRGGGIRTSESGDLVSPLAEELDDQRIEEMISRVLARMSSEAPPLAPGDELPISAKPGSQASLGGGEADPIDLLLAETEDTGDGVQDDPGMGEFRRRVRRAQDLNRKEDEIRGIFTTLDRLGNEGQIAALNDEQKAAATKTIISNRLEARGLWGKVWSATDGQGLSRRDRFSAAREQIRTEYSSLRDQTMKDLEEVMPAVDAKIVVEQTGRGDRGARMFGGGAGRTSRRGR